VLVLPVAAGMAEQLQQQLLLMLFNSLLLLLVADSGTELT
jgi:hypothetical protein